MMIEALADGAVNMGMTRSLAYTLATQTVIGAGFMAQKSNAHPGQLKDDVASPAGKSISFTKTIHIHALRGVMSTLVLIM